MRELREACEKLVHSAYKRDGDFAFVRTELIDAIGAALAASPAGGWREVTGTALPTVEKGYQPRGASGPKRPPTGGSSVRRGDDPDEDAEPESECGEDV